MHKRIKAWIAFKNQKGIKLIDKYNILNKWGEPVNYIGTPHSSIQESQLVPYKVSNIWSKTDLEFDQHIDKIFEEHEMKFCSIMDPEYPEILKSLYCPPMYLFYKGNLAIADNCIAIIGTRKVSNYGVRVTNTLVDKLVDAGVTIVSGLSYGVDSEAHQAALKKSGKTIAILPGSIDLIYPPGNREMANSIAENGLVLSEYLPGEKVERWHFPERNRLISGISKAVIMIEGPEKSGALITARFALEQNRALYAIPGDITRETAKGSNKLISMGATPVIDIDELMTDLGVKVSKSAKTISKVAKNPIYKLILKAEEPLDIDTMIELSGQSFGELSANLLELEMEGVIKRIAGSRYTPIK